MNFILSSLVLLLRLAPFSEGIASEMYSQNVICRQNYCTNPIYPGLNDLPRLEMLRWQCSDYNTMSGYLNFCKGAVYYPAALPSPNVSSMPVNVLVKAQDDAAATMFFYHLNAMGYDAWNHQEPSRETDNCVKSVWRMVCFTYFPRSAPGCQVGQGINYKRPCMDSCSSYMKSCQVECCDESPQCIFQTTVDEGNGTALVQTGYVDANGPSALCTGGDENLRNGSQRSSRVPWVLLFGLTFINFFVGTTQGGKHQTAANKQGQQRGRGRGAKFFTGGILLACALSLGGCALDVPRHAVGNWRKKSDYLVAYEFVQPGQTGQTAVLNSCSVRGLQQTLQCSGRGYCKAWNPVTDNTLAQTQEPIYFCECERDWADPECRTKRKSQITAFVLSLFLGWLGVDYFYLGFPLWGLLKLFTLGGCGFWWLVDIVRTGSGPIYAHDYRVANDLSHWVYVIVTLTFFLVLGFFLAIEQYLTYRNKRRAEQMKMQNHEEGSMMGKTGEELWGARGGGLGPRAGRAYDEYGGYGAMAGAQPGMQQMPAQQVQYQGGAPYGSYGGYAGPL